MNKQMSRDIGRFLQTFLKEEGISCKDYPTIRFLRSSPPNQWDFAWSFRQLIDCHPITLAYHIEAENATVKDESGDYAVDYFAVLLHKEGDAWGDPIVQSNIEDIYPGLTEQKLLKERFERFGRKASRAILALVGVAEYPRRFEDSEAP
jgi:hypothetical protein